MKKQLFLIAALASVAPVKAVEQSVPISLDSDFCLAEETTHLNLWAARIIDLLPAPGQFTNTSTADIDFAQTALEKHETNIFASLGSFGGYIVYGFDTPVKNNPKNPYGIDFQIAGNPLNVGRRGSWWAEAGAVQVMKDLNGNGEPDDGEWYELAGSDYWLSSTVKNVEVTYLNPGYEGRYTVPFTSNVGLEGALLTNAFHSQPYYPLPENYANSSLYQVTLSGNMIKGVLDKRNPANIAFYRGPAFGYSDNWGASLNPSEIPNPYNLKENYESGETMPIDGFDISWAVDKNGNHVELDEIDFVRVYCPMWSNAGWLGEVSTEVGCVVMTIPDENYEPQDVYLNYTGITQIQVVAGYTCRYEGLVFCNGRPVAEGVNPVWTVADETIGTIDNTGLFTAKAVGSTKITYQGTDKAIPDVFEVQVVELSDVAVDLEGNASSVDNSKISCIEGETIYINVESLTTGAEMGKNKKQQRFVYDNYTWSNSNAKVGTISRCLFKALQPGVTTLVATSEYNPELTATIEVTVETLPELEQLISEVELTEQNIAGELTASQIFKVGNKGSVVYLENFSDDIGVEPTLSAADGCVTLNPLTNKLVYDFSAAEDIDATVVMNVRSYKREYQCSLRFFMKSDGVNNVMVDAEVQGDAMWYNVQGMFLGHNLDSADMPTGIYIIRQGSSVRKISL